jgi:hypothetical protein
VGPFPSQIDPQAGVAKMVSFRSTFGGIDDLEGLPMTSATAAPAARMPAAFLGHGTPMNAIDRNRTPRPGARSGRGFPARVRF